MTKQIELNAAVPSSHYCIWTFDIIKKIWTADNTHCLKGSCIDPGPTAPVPVPTTVTVTHDDFYKGIIAKNVDIKLYNKNQKRGATLKPLLTVVSNNVADIAVDSIYTMSCYP